MQPQRTKEQSHEKTIEHGYHGCTRIFFQYENRASHIEKTTEFAEYTEIITPHCALRV